MKAKELIELFREEADDTSDSHLWKTAILLRHLDQAQRQAARRARILREAVDPAVCVYDISMGKPFVKLHESVISITHAQFEFYLPDNPDEKQVRILRRKHAKDLQGETVGWREEDGDVIAFVTDIQLQQVRLYRNPIIAGKLRIECERMPLNKIKSIEDCLELEEKYAEDLIYWMLYKAFSKRDAETFDPKRADQYLARFENVFGPVSSAIDEQHIGNLADLRHRGTRFY